MFSYKNEILASPQKKLKQAKEKKTDAAKKKWRD